MSDLVWMGIFFLLWLILQVWILPRLGVNT